MDTSPRNLVLALCWFAGLAGGMLWLLSGDLRPAPLYPVMSAVDSVAVVGERPITLEWTPPRMPSALLVPMALEGAARLRVRITDASEDHVLTDTWLDASNLASPRLARVELPPLRSRPGPTRVEFASEELSPSGAPRIAWSGRPPEWAATVRRGGREVHLGGPLLMVEYPWWSRSTLWLWLGLLPLAVLVLRRGQGAPALVVALGLAATVTSILLWQRDYSRHFAHWDADEFGTYAAKIASYLTVPASREATRRWFGQYIHAQNPLGPALMALPIALGLPTHLVYVAFSGACSFLSLLIVLRVLEHELGISRPARLLIVMLYGCHLIFLRSFARPVTDALGHLLTVATLALLLGCRSGPSPFQMAALGALDLLHPLARPQGLAYVPFVTGAVITLAAARERERALRSAGRAVLVLAVIPLSILLGLFVVFGWWTNVRVLALVAERFRPWSTLGTFSWSLAGVLQLVPLVWLMARGHWWNGAATLLAAWIAYYLAVLVLVRAPFWMRHFLPILPAVMGLTALALEAMRGRLRAAGFVLAAALCVANVAAIAYLICDHTNLTLELFSTFTLG